MSSSENPNLFFLTNHTPTVSLHYENQQSKVIPIFGKIRKRMAEDNKTGKPASYLPYVIPQSGTTTCIPQTAVDSLSGGKHER